MVPGKNGFVNGIASVTPTSYRSWPPDSTYVNGKNLSVQERTMSEPIMSSRDNINIIPAPGSGPGPGPPHKLALSMKAHSIRTQEIADIPVIFVLGNPLRFLLRIKENRLRFNEFRLR